MSSLSHARRSLGGATVNVADLAEELDLAPSTVLAHCHRVGVDATWAGAELSHADVAVLQAELAGPDRSDTSRARQVGGASTISDTPGQSHESDRPTLRPAPPGLPSSEKDVVPSPVGAPSPSLAASPAVGSPSSVGSAPGGPDSLAPPTVADPAPGTEPSSAAAMAVTGAASVLPPRRTSAHAVAPHLQRNVRASIVALVVAAGLFVGATFIDNVWIVAAVWFVAAIVIVSALISSIRGWYRASTHPDQVKGHYLSIGVVIISLAAAVGLGLGIWTVVRSAPARTAPLGIGDNASVKHLRWGYQRIVLVKSIGWNPPAKDAGTCWLQQGKQRRQERVETGFTETPCSEAHRIEVLDVWAVNKDADAPYPGKDALIAFAERRCGRRLMGLNTATDTRPAVGVSFGAEYPTEKGWEASDHTVSCLALTAPRQGALSR